ncbi:lysosomal proton-coupled steroid conjugate and bile acid symporter SLC46A3-like [Amphiura filiformis]|uniref:lysosomal proton-coupled steroid conjugate and bile acid symporter SLC46A3-like n=1 Tax=Amphiura filiformis TaxID=82378 RepID=UPI003B21BD98
MVAFPKYIEERLAEDRNFTLLKDDALNDSCINKQGTNDSDYQIQQDIAAETAYWVMIGSVFIYVPATFTGPFFGALSDRLGRKLPLLISSLAFALWLFAIGIMAVFRLPLLYLACANSIAGMGGGYTSFLGGCYAYFSDVSRGKSRLLRIAVARAVFEGSAGLAQIPAAYFMQEYGFESLVWLTFGFVIVAILYILSPCIPLPPRVGSYSAKKNSFKTLAKDIMDIFAVNTEKRRIRLGIFLLICFVTDLIQLSVGATEIFILYGLGPPLCWTSATAGIYSFTLLTCGALGVLFLSRLFAVCVNYFGILQIAYIFGTISYLISAFAKTTQVFMLGAVVSAFRAMDSPVLQTMLSTLVEPNERGTVFALAASMQSLANCISPLIFNPIYSATVDTQPNAVFFVMSSGYIVLFLLSWTWLMYTNRTTRTKHTKLGQTDA